jgi:putative phosphoesterase
VKIAILSDSHGLLRPGVFPLIEGVEAILHAGDVGPGELLLELEAVAPVTAVWGNTDDFDLRHRLPEVAEWEWQGKRIVLLHGHRLGVPTPSALAALYPEADLLVFGHTHRPLIERVGTVLVVNPGGCGHRRFGLPPTLILAELREDGMSAELLEIPE